MADTIDEVSYNYEEEGRLVRKEIKKEVLTKGAWATVMFLYQELDKKTEVWGEPKVSIVRFKKASGQYRKQSSFNISSENQARQIVDVIDRWYSDAEMKQLSAEAQAAKASAKKSGGGAAAKEPAADAPDDE